MVDANLEELRRRVQRLEDIDAIKLVKSQYLNACDQQDPEKAKNCFAEGEVVIDLGHIGVFRTRDEFAALFRAAGCHPFVLDQHHGANHEIEFVDDNHAKVLSALGYHNINTRDKTVTFLSLIYHDEFAKFGSVWKITKSVAEFKTALHCSYASGNLEALLAGQSVASTGAQT